jgi:hypothetical protein
MHKGGLAAGAALALAVAAVWTAPPAQAQQACSAKKAKKRGFGRLMTGLQGSIGGALRGDGNLASDLAGTAEASARAAAVCLPPDASEAQPDPAGSASNSAPPAPRKAKAEKVTYPSRMPIPDEWKAAKQAYDEFGKIKCSDCEGGHAYAGWPDWPRDEYDGKYGGSETRLSKATDRPRPSLVVLRLCGHADDRRRGRAKRLQVPAHDLSAGKRRQERGEAEPDLLGQAERIRRQRELGGGVLKARGGNQPSLGFSRGRKISALPPSPVPPRPGRSAASRRRSGGRHDHPSAASPRLHRLSGKPRSRRHRRTK